MKLELSGVGKSYGNLRALHGVDLRVASGEFVCVVGASGSGKSTLLSLVAGLDVPTEGQITLDGADVTGPGPDRGLVPQAGTLYPWRTVERNVAFGLELLPITPEDRAARVDWHLAETGLTDFRHALPKQLSGGQQQRVAIARALACEPEVLLLDEPFGALDVQTKEDMQVLVRQVWKDTGTTVLMVTHDVEEAVFLGGRVVVLACDPGRVAADITVALPEDRDLDVKRHPDFLALRASIEDIVRAQHRAYTARATAGGR
ncbi:NitT/TauT family transport system ATP-binding protein [Actinokineospora alba]|uniref:NitT/TauT family transport system ATP-binding protein n=1 Tax=Actinokineospora alba TaxID=504798 RepID=A0A1H0VDL1_9PSEU|nr:ABC transporter ATP-binding protein [Actinokineospora alba]TDP65653.1 NitT/TauT family transport system ATP-binding protein [Actinokineospora alba]SDH67595.1 NitT/TauT family transport system ATP-binding protein [Actinokineospora alba]SDP76434.1 NitT/TauT family transport system ATP-binding protein [Actinokineospora alba]